MTTPVIDYGETWTIPADDTHATPIGLRAYHVPFFRAITCFIHGFKRTTRETKFHLLAEALAEQRIATVGIDLNLNDVQPRLTFKELLGRIETAEEHLRQDRGWKITNYVGHSLGSCLVTRHLYAKMQRERRYHRGNVVMLSPALNQRDLLRYWHFRGKERTTSFGEYCVGWNNTRELRFLTEKKSILPRYAQDYIHHDFSSETHNLGLPNEITGMKAIPHLMVLGMLDRTVPVESNTRAFPHQTVVSDDHELERPDSLAIWIPAAVQHLSQGIL